MTTPKYRDLTTEELQQFEQQFIEFLIVNGIVAEDWEKIKQENPEEAEAIVTKFSDVVFEGVFRKVKFMEVVTKHDIKAFQCLDEKIVLVGLQAPALSDIDFTDPQILDQAMNGELEGVKIYTTDKPYAKERGVELFEMNNAGAQISNGSLFKTLSLGLAGT